jgi:hypothetical protein
MAALSLWFVFFSRLILLFLPPLIWILTLVALLSALMAGLIALLLLALVSKVLLLLVALIFLLGVHSYNYLQELESGVEISLRGCHSVSRLPKVTFSFGCRTK